MSDTLDRLLLDPRTTAAHEAGHAVAYLLHRRSFRYVTIRAKGGPGSGQVAVRPRRMDAFARAVIAAAGPAAEARHLRSFGLDEDEVIGMILLGGCGSDFQKMKVQGAPAGFAEAYVEQVLAPLWGSVDRLAGRLVERGTVHFPEVRQLLPEIHPTWTTGGAA